MWQERAQEMPRAGGGDTRARFPLSDPPPPPPRALEVTPQPQGDSHQGPRALRAQGSPCLEPQGSERERERERECCGRALDFLSVSGTGAPMW